MRLFSLWGAVICVLGIVLIPSTRGLYFHIGETEKKCFIEEIPDETILIGNYKVQLFDRCEVAGFVSWLVVILGKENQLPIEWIHECDILSFLLGA